MDPIVQHKIERIKELAQEFNRAVLTLYNDPDAANVKIEVDAIHIAEIGRLYERPLLQVKLSEVKTL